MESGVYKFEQIDSCHYFTDAIFFTHCPNDFHGTCFN